jgi:hypothetical protein
MNTLKQSETIGYFCSQIHQVSLRRKRSHFVFAFKNWSKHISRLNLKTHLEAKQATFGNSSEKTKIKLANIELKVPKDN